jgi:hypothetical protein
MSVGIRKEMDSLGEVDVAAECGCTSGIDLGPIDYVKYAEALPVRC